MSELCGKVIVSLKVKVMRGEVLMCVLTCSCIAYTTLSGQHTLMDLFLLKWEFPVGHMYLK